MTIKKRRSYQQIMEEVSIETIRSLLPEQWVVHEYRPDYGIDFVVELFRYTDDTEEMAESLGELFFVQAKSIRNTRFRTMKYYPRRNIEIANLVEDKREYVEDEIISFKIDTPELATIQAMGSAIPVLLLLVSLDTDRVFFVCLNDLIDKVVLPTDSTYATKGEKTIHIPTRNELKRGRQEHLALTWYAKRMKLYSLFQKANYQLGILQRLLSDERESDAWETALHFLRILRSHDVWHKIEHFPILQDIDEELSNLERISGSISTSEIIELAEHTVDVWTRLNNIGHIYEEIGREWFLPTFLARKLGPTLD
jgi:hypothetical protein